VSRESAFDVAAGRRALTPPTPGRAPGTAPIEGERRRACPRDHARPDHATAWSRPGIGRRRRALPAPARNAAGFAAGLGSGRDSPGRLCTQPPKRRPD
jgi:hypothetical protein